MQPAREGAILSGPQTGPTQGAALNRSPRLIAGALCGILIAATVAPPAAPADREGAAVFAGPLWKLKPMRWPVLLCVVGLDELRMTAELLGAEQGKPFAVWREDKAGRVAPPPAGRRADDCAHVAEHSVYLAPGMLQALGHELRHLQEGSFHD